MPATTEEAQVPTRRQNVSRHEQNEALRKKAARQAAKVDAPEVPPDIVECRVLHLGDGKISMGEHVSGVGEVHYEKGETFKAERSHAEWLQNKGYVEIT